MNCYQDFKKLIFYFLRHSFLTSFPTVPTFRCLLKVLWNTQTNNISLGAQSQPQTRRDVQDIRKEPFLQIKSRFHESKSLSLNLYLFLRLVKKIVFSFNSTRSWVLMLKKYVSWAILPTQKWTKLPYEKLGSPKLLNSKLPFESYISFHELATTSKSELI